MGVFTWKGGSGQGGSGNLALAANWLNEDDPADPVVPGADDGVLIDATGTLTGSLDVQSETISGNLTLAGQMTAAGGAGISSGTLAASGTATKLIVDDLSIGSNGAGALTVSNSAHVAIATYLELGTEQGSTGAVSINSAGTLTTTTIFIGGQTGSPGSIGISGAGSALTADGFVGVGGAGKGNLSIALGGVFSDIDPGDGVSIANTAGVAGAASVSGKGSALIDAGHLTVGYAGTGTLSIANDGWLSITAAHGTNVQQGVVLGAVAGASGAVTVAGAGSAITDVGFFVVGDSGTGSLAVNTGAAVTVSNQSGIVVAGRTGASGSLSVSGGGAMYTTSGVTVGNSAGANGSVTVTGVGSLIYSNGYLGIGGPGKGSLTIAAGGKVTDANLSVGVSAGAQAGGVGNILVTGGGSKLAVASYVEIGYAGTGALSIAAGGAVAIDGPQGNSTATVLAGGVAGGSGAITVDGAGSTLTADSTFGIGYGGKGSLSVTNGASVDENGSGVEAFEIGSLAGSTGSVSVSGAGSKLISATGIRVGASGVGSMSITAGATATATEYLVFGFATGSHGYGGITGATVTVGQAGPGTSGVWIGENGVGTLTLCAGGVLTDADTAAVGVGSSLFMAGGSFSSTGTTNQGVIEGFGAIKGAIANAGVIEATGSVGLTVTGSIMNAGWLVVAGGKLTVAGAVSENGLVAINGGTADFAGTFNENVTFSGSTGTLELAHAQSYSGKITGFSLTGATSLDLADIGFTSGVTKAAYSGSTTSGVLTVTSGAEVATIHLVGDYKSSIWTLSGDGHGGTTIVDPTNPAAAATPRPTSAVLPFIAAMASFDPGGSDWIGAAESVTSHPLLLAAVRSGR